MILSVDKEALKEGLDEARVKKECILAALLSIGFKITNDMRGVYIDIETPVFTDGDNVMNYWNGKEYVRMTKLLFFSNSFRLANDTKRGYQYKKIDFEWVFENILNEAQQERALYSLDILRGL